MLPVLVQQAGSDCLLHGWACRLTISPAHSPTCARSCLAHTAHTSLYPCLFPTLTGAGPHGVHRGPAHHRISRGARRGHTAACARGGWHQQGRGAAGPAQGRAVRAPMKLPSLILQELFVAVRLFELGKLACTIGS